MKIKIGPYLNCFGGYQLAEKICFWAKPVKDEYGFESAPEWVDNFGEWLSETWIHTFLQWTYNKRKRNIKIHIDNYDTWNMEITLAYIIVPLLKQLRDETHGYPIEFATEDDDSGYQRLFEGEGFEFDEDAGSDAWTETLNKMIWAFEQVIDFDWEDQYRTGKADFQWADSDYEDGTGLKYSTMIDGPNHTLEVDLVGMRKHQERMQEGFDLFGKYYHGLWD